MTNPGASAEVYLTDEVAGVEKLDRGYGLHKGVLSPIETLAQSVSAIAPSSSPSLTVPLVFALAGNGTWFVYLLTTLAMLLVGFCISRFARMSSSPGSLYSYTADTLRRIYEDIDRLETTEVEVKKYQHYDELFGHVAIAGLGILLLEMVLAQTVWRKLP